MTLLYIDGFEHRDPTRYPTGAPAFFDAASESDCDPRFGVGTYIRAWNAEPYVVPFPLSARVIVGFAFWSGPTGNAGTGTLFDLRDSAAARAHLHYSRETDGSIKALLDNFGTVATTPANVLPSGTWVYVEIATLLGNANGNITIHVNGTEVLNWTGDTTRTPGYNEIEATGYDSIRVGGGYVHRFDDMYIANGEGTTHNTFLGDVRIHTLIPNGNGTHSGLVGSDGNSVDNYLLVDELPPSEVDYVGSGVAGAKDTYVFSDLPKTAPILAIQHGMSAYKSDAGSINMRSVLRAGGADYAGSPFAIGATKSAYLRLAPVNPATGAAWTTAEVNALEAGMEIVP